MKQINQNSIDKDKLLAELINETKIEASDNLKFRIMQQIATEKALTTKKTVINTNSVLKSVLTVFCIMYALIICVLAATFYIFGESVFKSLPIQLSIISIASICSVFGLIIVFDEKRRNKKQIIK